MGDVVFRASVYLNYMEAQHLRPISKSYESIGKGYSRSQAMARSRLGKISRVNIYISDGNDTCTVDRCQSRVACFRLANCMDDALKNACKSANGVSACWGRFEGSRPSDCDPNLATCGMNSQNLGNPVSLCRSLPQSAARAPRLQKRTTQAYFFPYTKGCVPMAGTQLSGRD